MDWLRSEDLKEEKVVTTPVQLYHARKWLACSKKLTTEAIKENCDAESSFVSEIVKTSVFFGNEVLVVENDVEK